MAEEFGDDDAVGAAAYEGRREGVAQDMLVPTSAQARLCRCPRYADVGRFAPAFCLLRSDFATWEIGIIAIPEVGPRARRGPVAWRLAPTRARPGAV